ncbi:MAG: DUF354 domain-containing protein [Candidatus Saliniplasma sp.]
MSQLKVLLVIAHPAHVHFFKNLIWEMEEEGHEFNLMVKERENTTALMDLLGFEYETFGKTYKSRLGKGIGVVHNDLSLVSKARKFEPDITASIGGLYSVHAGSMLGSTTIDFMDTEIATFTNLLTFPCADVIATPDCYRSQVPKGKHLKYRGYHELAYLHPNRFEPEKWVVHKLGLVPRNYTIVRFSSFDARHQADEGVLTRRDKIDLVRLLSDYGQVVVDSEGPLPQPIRSYSMDIPEHRFHDILAYSRMYIGEGATTASEAGVLGVPWIYLSNKTRGYLEDQEVHYELGAQINTIHDAFFTLRSILEEEVEVDFNAARKRLLRDKIDVTRWMKRLFEHFGK